MAQELVNTESLSKNYALRGPAITTPEAPRQPQGGRGFLLTAPRKVSFRAVGPALLPGTGPAISANSARCLAVVTPNSTSLHLLFILSSLSGTLTGHSPFPLNPMFLGLTSHHPVRSLRWCFPGSSSISLHPRSTSSAGSHLPFSARVVC